MATSDDSVNTLATYPVRVSVQPATTNRNRLTIFFRVFLAIPHILLVGGPLVAATWFGWSDDHISWEWGSGGVLGAVACVVSVIAWFAILFTGVYPEGLWKLAAFYMRWRTRVLAYLALVRDEYPPFGDGDYPVELTIEAPTAPRDRLSVAFRLLLAIPHLIVLGVLSVVWAFTTAIAWIVLLLTRRYPDTLYGFAIGMLAWNARVDAYLLLLRDEYPPFTLRA